MKKLLVFVIALLIALAGCTQKNPEPSSELADKPYMNSNYNFEIYPPKGWKIALDDPDVEFEFFDTYGYLSVMVDYPNDSSTQRIYSEFTYDDYCDIGVYSLEFLGASKTNITKEKVIVEGIEACKVSVSGLEVSIPDLTFLKPKFDASYIVFNKGSVNYTFIILVYHNLPPSKKQLYNEIIDKSLSTFRFLNKT